MNSKFLTKIKETENVILTYCRDNSDVWWNFAFLKKLITDDELQKIEDFFKKVDKKPTIYFLDDEKYKEISKSLLNKRYEISSKDYWMFWNKDIPSVDETDIIEVKSNEEFEKWIETFIKSYPKDDPQNPYGEQTQFANIIRKAWNEKKTKEDKYFLVLDNKTPVAVGILTNYNGMGYISGIGAIPSFRGKGFGKRISLYCVKKSFEQGNKIHFLATEKGHYPFNFYERIGFKPEFIATYYTKQLQENKFDLVKREIENILPNSPLDFELKHSELVLKWVLKLNPDADESLKISALSHDIDRAITKITEKDLKDYSKINEFKKEHAIRSANFISDFLKSMIIPNRLLIGLSIL